MGIVLVYSCDNKESFDSVKGWMADIKSSQAKEAVKIILLGNKNDLMTKDSVQIE